MKIINGLVFDNNCTFNRHDILIEGEIITQISSYTDSEEDEIIDAKGLYVIPGLIDIHLHGAVGKDVCDGKRGSIHDIARYNAMNGVLAICPTTMTVSEEDLVRACVAVKDFAQSMDAGSADIIGINLEGPFISADRLGAQNSKYVMKPDMELIDKLQKLSDGFIKIINIAPEAEGAMEFIDKNSKNIRISIAHTNCSYETAKEAIKSGAAQLTHTFNAMPGIGHRTPGPVIAAYEEGINITLISDGIHIHPAMVRFVFDMFKDKVVLISDSMEATGLPDGRYKLGGQAVIKSNRRASLEGNEEVIAGSVMNLFDCMKEAVTGMKIPLAEAVKAVTVNPAKAIGIYNKYGSIENGKYANLVILDESLNIIKIIKHGKLL